MYPQMGGSLSQKHRTTDTPTGGPEPTGTATTAVGTTGQTVRAQQQDIGPTTT